jgi:anti-anti-sigma factor
MSLTFKTEENQLICIFSGRMDTVSCTDVQNEVKEKVAENDGEVIFDMENVDYISSSFLRICVSAVAVAKDKFSMIKVTPNIKKVLMISGLADKLNLS